jgi:hypothetical protein
MLGGGETMITTEPVAEESATEVAVTVTLRFAGTVEGALYVAALVVVLVRVPRDAPVPETLQVTPLSLESFSTVAVNFTVCP